MTAPAPGRDAAPVKIRRRAPVLLIGTTLLVIAVMTAISQLLTNRLLQNAHAEDFHLMQQIFTTVLKGAEDRALVRAELVTAMPAVRTAFANRDRPKLLAECKDMFREQEEKYGLDQGQFHVPPGVSFLRLHKPEAFGDEQASYRPMLADAQQTQALRKGIAITKAGPTITGIVPVQDDAGKFVGTFEMGLELAPVVDRLKEGYGFEAAIYFEEKQLRELATDMPPEIVTPKNRVGKYIRYHATHPDLMAALVLDRDVDVTEAKSYEREVMGRAYGVQLLPVFNFANKQIGVVAIADDFGDEKAEARRARVWQLLSALFGVVLLAGLIIIVLRGYVFSPLAALNERMAALAAGDASKPAEPMDGYAEELSDLAESYEKIRAGKQG